MNAYETLESFRKLQRDWDSYGAVPIDHRCIDKAREFLTLLKASHGWTPVPMNDGGVQLEWHKDGFDIELTISLAADGEVNG